MKFSVPMGATPLDPDTIAGLIPNLATQAELNEFEARNISNAEQWAKRARGDNRDMLLVSTLRKLHFQMFNMTWIWAGKYRQSDTNIGIDWSHIPIQLEQLCGNIRFQVQNEVYPLDETAARFHHDLVRIHPFPNGNGRHGRLATDWLLKHKIGRAHV